MADRGIAPICFCRYSDTRRRSEDGGCIRDVRLLKSGVARGIMVRFHLRLTQILVAGRRGVGRVPTKRWPVGPPLRHSAAGPTSRSLRAIIDEIPLLSKFCRGLRDQQLSRECRFRQFKTLREAVTWLSFVESSDPEPLPVRGTDIRGTTPSPAPAPDSRDACRVKCSRCSVSGHYRSQCPRRPPQ